jgi:hypothetical protein
MDKGQVSIDFLIAITIFVIGLVLLISQVPMLFTPLQTVSTDIQPVAYRTSMILAEDGGIYESVGEIRSNWEDPAGLGNYTQNCKKISNYHENVKRIGLARSAPGWSSSEDIIPNNLSVEKIKALRDWWKDGNSSKEGNSSWITNKSGLLVTYNNNPLNYSYNISLEAFNGSLIKDSTNNNKLLLQIGDSIPESGATVEKIERIIAIDNTTGLTNYTKIGDANCSKLVVCIWR